MKLLNSAGSEALHHRSLLFRQHWRLLCTVVILAWITLIALVLARAIQASDHGVSSELEQVMRQR